MVIDLLAEVFAFYFVVTAYTERIIKLNAEQLVLNKALPKRDYRRYFCIIVKKGGAFHSGLTEKLSFLRLIKRFTIPASHPAGFFHATKGG